MKNILVISGDPHTAGDIRSAFETDVNVHCRSDVKEALKVLSKK
jgi:hypothetical protein